MQTSRRTPALVSLPRVDERVSYLYIERSRIERDDGYISVLKADTPLTIPAATIACLLIGPGCSVTTDAMALLSECGVSVCWVGGRGDIHHLSSSSLSKSAKLLERQASLSSNQSSRLSVARKMFAKRFGDVDVDAPNMRSLLGMEGARVKSLYKQLAREHGVEWTGRKYLGEDPTNKTLSLANSVIYAATNSCVSSLGMSPGLGFVHRGYHLSFVLDIADLYKHETSIPLAFEMTANHRMPEPQEVREALRSRLFEKNVLKRMPSDIIELMGGDAENDNSLGVVVELWEGKITKDGIPI